MNDFDKAVEISLRTWYPKDHPLHYNPHHPLGKLLGEWGELLDDYMKSLYKPGYEFEPIDELGDIWYYVRVLCYQKKHKPVNFSIINNESVDTVMALAMWELSRKFVHINEGGKANLGNTLNWTFSALLHICNSYDITLQQLTESNWQKLKPGSERGEQWAKARVQTDYVGGKVELKNV